MSSTRVALAGATGNLGRPILNSLLLAGFHVTVLSRKGSGNAATLGRHPNLMVEEVGFTDVPTLTVVLFGVEVVISCLATVAIGDQNPLIDAAVAAGVKRFIPAEFGMDSLNPNCAKLAVCQPKVATQKYLLEKSNANPTFTYTSIANGLFLDWCLGMGIIINIPQRTAILYNGGDVPFSATLLSDIAKAVLGVITHQAETKNRVVYVHSALVTQKKLIQYAVNKDSRVWQTTEQETRVIRLRSVEERKKGTAIDIARANLMDSICGCFETDYGCDFSDRLDNELLGVKEMNETQLRALVESFM
ncbi:oxidoreductase CipA-like protein [Hypomontagnella monticulosa]|nr:oxidoreductase CipA-like protein [Hypomontagnella monticulosa]